MLLIRKVRRPGEGRGRGFAIKRAIRAREAAQFPEAVGGGDFGHRRAPVIGERECVPHMLHLPQPEISPGTHPQMFLATDPQRSV